MNTSHTATPIDIRRASDRFVTDFGWLDSKHSFSFGHHRDRTNTHHGLLVVNNDDIVRGGTGFDTHPHQDMEIVTWVLSGTLEHKDSERNRGVIYPGLAQRMSAGRGIWHSEMNNSGTEDVHFVQMWVLPDTERIDPGYEQLDINDELAKGGLVPIASGKGHDAAISIRQAGAVLWGGRLSSGETVDVPEDLHVFVAQGAARLDGAPGTNGVHAAGGSTDGTRLDAGDAARVTDLGGLTLTAHDDGAEVLVWATA
jgi:hypothetical protein